MIKGSSARQADHPIDAQFIDRWSARAMSGEPVSRQDLLTLLEAARWAPSSYNLQPWRILYAQRDTPDWPLFFNLLVDMNKSWVQHASALLVFVSHKPGFKGEPSRTHSFDSGAAWAFLALQGTAKGFVVHGMSGLDYPRARTDLDIPDDYQIEMMVAIGKPGLKELLPQKLLDYEQPNGRRKLMETAFAGKWPTSQAVCPREL